MSDQPITNLKVPYSDYSLTDALDALKTNILLSLNCHAIATVFEFTPSDTINGRPKLSAKMAYSKTYLVQAADGTYSNKVVEYAGLIDCPAFFLGGSGATLQIPPAPGDECLILFNDRDIDNWWRGSASGGPVASSRLHSFSDAIAIVGFGKWSINDMAHAMLTNGNAQLGIALSGALVRIANNSTTLYACLSSLITAIEGIKVSPGTFMAGGNSVSGISGSVSSTSALEDARTLLQSLLE